MNDSDALELRWPYVAARFLLWGSFATALYLFSIGPAYWLLMGRSESHTAQALRFYTPIYRLAEVAPVSDVFGTYCMWWAELPGGTVERTVHGVRN
jgi:hypothetical protein